MTWKSLKLLALLAVLAGRAEIALAFDDCTLCGGSDVPPGNNPPQSKPPPDVPPPCPPSTGSGGKICKEKTASPPACAGDPVALDGGSINISRTDFELNGIIPIRMEFNYHSSSNLVGHYGFGWYLNYEMRIFLDEDGNYFYRTASGEVRKYSPLGVQLKGESSQDIFKVNPNGTYKIERFDGLIYEFNSWGTLSFILDRSGNYLHFIYEDGGTGNPIKLPIYGVSRHMPYTDYFEIAGYDYRLKRIENGLSPTRQFIEMRYNNFGYVDQVMDQAGRTFQYTYDPNYGTLLQVTNPVGEFVYYNYNPGSPFQITSFVNQARCSQDNNDLVVNEYGPDGKITRQTFNGKELVFSDPINSVSYQNVVIGGQNTTLRTSVNLSHFTTRNFDGAGGALLNSMDTYYLDSVMTYDPPLATSETRRTKTDSFLVLMPDLTTRPQVIKETEFLDNKGMRTFRRIPDGSTYVYKYDSRLRLIEEDENIFNPVSLDTAHNFTRYQYFGIYNLRTRISKGQIGGDSAVTVNEYDPLTLKLRFSKDYANPADPSTAVVTEYRYDNLGLQSEVINPRGASTKFEYDDVPFGTPNGVGTGFKTAKTNSLNQRTEWVNNEIGLPLKVTNPAGFETNYEYDAMGKVTKECDALDVCTKNTYLNTSLIRTEDGVVGNQTGRVTRIEYDNQGRVSRRIRVMEDGTDHILEAFLYDADGREIRESDQGGLVRRNEYDPLGRRISVIDSSGGAYRTSYDVNGHISFEIDPFGYRTDYVYDALGRLLKKVDPVNSQLPLGQQAFETWEYDFRGNVLKYRNALRQATTYQYNGLGLEVQKIGVLNDTTVQQYVNGLRTSYKFPNGALQWVTFDGEGRLIKILNKVGDASPVRDNDDYQEESVFGTNGKVVKKIIQGQITHRSGYDGNGRVVADTNAVGAVETFGYTPLGQLAWILYPSGQKSEFTYNNLGKMTSEFDQSGLQKSLKYDARSRIVETRIPNKGSVFKTYDAIGGLTRITDSIGVYENYELDPLSRRVARSGNTGNRNQIVYDGRDRITRQIDASGRKVDYIYDALDRLISVKDNENNETKIRYDEIPGSRKKTTTYPSGHTSEEEWNRQEQLIATTDGNGQKSQYKYDSLGRVVEIQYLPGGVKHVFEYDSFNRVKKISKGGIQTEYTYDNAGKITSTKETIGGSTYIIKYSLNDVTNVQTVTYPDGLVLKKFLDGRNRIIKQTVGNRDIEVIHYNGFTVGNQILGNGIRSDFTHDASGRTTQLDYTLGQSSLLSFGIGRNANGLIKAIRKYHQPIASESFSYDPSSQVSEFRVGQLNASDSVLSPVYSESRTLDSRGNWSNSIVNGSNQNRSHNADNQVTGLNGQSISYDLAGNISAQGASSLQWDPENKLGSVNSVIYGYDGEDRRVTKSINGQTVNYIYDGSRVIYEESSDGSSKDFIYGSYIDEPIAMILKSAGMSDTIYYLAGLNQTIEALSDNHGSIVERYQTRDFGQPIIFSNSGNDGIWFTPDDGIATAGNFGNQYIFQGRQFDSESGLYYYRNRYYNPDLGRFISRDPLGFDGGDFNLYRFVFNFPFKKDPYGLSSECQYTGKESRLAHWPITVVSRTALKVVRHAEVATWDLPGFTNEKEESSPDPSNGMKGDVIESFYCKCDVFEIGTLDKVLYRADFDVTKEKKCCIGDECSKTCNTYQEVSVELGKTFPGEETVYYKKPNEYRVRLLGTEWGCPCKDLEVGGGGGE